jgi:phytoene dehydrogenase-like protein
VQDYDAIVIGGGHNGLVNAAYLARAGKRVLLLERRPLLGGATATEEIVPGFKFTVFSYVVSLLRPEIVRELNLPAHGLTVLPLESTLSPTPEGGFLFRDGDHYRTYQSIARFSPRDADAYADYSRTMYFMAKAVKTVLGIIPPDPASFHPADLLGLARLAREYLNLPAEQFHTLARLMTMSAADFVERWFESEPLRGTLSASGIIGTFLGPRSPGTAYVLLHHYMGEIDGVFRAWGFAKGGTGAIAAAIASAARALGVEIRTEAEVAQVLVRDGRAYGVALANGDEIHARRIVSSLDPRQTFERFIEPRWLPPETLADVRRYLYRGSSGKVNLALDGLPELACWPGRGRHLAGAISISPSVKYIEQAYDHAKYGAFSPRPYIDIILPSMIDPDMAPPGKHVMSCFVQYAPYHLRQGTWDEQREAFGEAVIDTLSEYFPNLRSLIVGKQVLTPLDIERRTGLTEGNIFQGELSLSQLFFLRPAPGLAQYKTPVRGYYQCGSASHPGGGITGAPGRLAALAILKDWN